MFSLEYADMSIEEAYAVQRQQACSPRCRAGAGPGDPVRLGSFIPPIDDEKGDTFQADYAPFGTVSCHFA